MLESAVVDLTLLLVLVLILLALDGGWRLALARRGFASCTGSSILLFGGGKLLCSGCLSLRVKVFDLSLAKDAARGSAKQSCSVRVQPFFCVLAHSLA